jgi:putative acetyltransferase
MNSPDTTIERATAGRPEDAIALIEEYYDAIDVVARDNRAYLLQFLESPSNAIWVAYCESLPAGCILYRPLPDLASAGEIKRLYVRPAFRGRGIASLLLGKLEDFARAQLVSWLYLDSKDDLKDAIVFYKRHGYLRCSRYNQNPQATIFMRKQVSPAVVIDLFQPGDEDAFRSLNEAWITRYFQLEEKDRDTLCHPQQHILSKNGQIFMARLDDKPVGCCALLALPDGSFEIAKMAVDDKLQARGIGRLLLEHVVGFARAHSVARLYLETNSSLKNAIHLYESVGFRNVPPERVSPSPYRRADVHMEMILAERVLSGALRQ